MILAYVFTGAFQYCIMQSLGELVVAFPIAGSFSVFSTRFLDPSWGFAMGWKYATHIHSYRLGVNSFFQLRFPMALCPSPRSHRRCPHDSILERRSAKSHIRHDLSPINRSNKLVRNQRLWRSRVYILNHENHCNCWVHVSCLCTFSKSILTDTVPLDY